MELYDVVNTLIEEKKLTSLKNLLNDSSLSDLLNLIQDLDPKNRLITYRLLDKDLALQVFENLDIEQQETLISSFAEDEVVALFQDLEPDTRVRVLDELPARVATKLLNSLSIEERQITSLLRGYPAETAGHIMTPEYVRLRQGDLVNQALGKVRQRGEEKESFYTYYVTDDERRLIGAVSLLRLVLSKPEQRIVEIMDSHPVRVTTHMDQEEVARLLHQVDLLAIPVVDNEDRLVGVITVDDAIDVLEVETTEDIFEKAGIDALWKDEAVRSNTLISGSFFDAFKVRVPFLILVLLGGMVAGVVVAEFEDALQAITAVAFFIPMIMDTGGNIGVQSATIFARGLALKQINPRRFLQHLLREVMIGAGISVFCGVIAGVLVLGWIGDVVMGFVVGLSVILTMTIATGLGFTIPFILVKFGIDQAAGSDPILTTLKDITGLLIYFFLVTSFLL